MKAYACTLLVLGWIGSSATALADGMRCGNLLVSEGDTKLRVEGRCGPPAEVTSWVEYRAVRVRVGDLWVEKTVEVKYDKWTYDRGRYSFVQYVTFENGQLIRVETGSYGDGA